jgi:hypothetical protein
MMWLTLVVAVTLGWWTESHRASQWKQRAEIAAGQLEAENLGKMVFGERGVTFVSWRYDDAIRESFIPTDPVW